MNYPMNILRGLLFTLVLLVAGQSYAATTGPEGLPSVELKVLGEKRLALTLADLQGKAQLRITDLNGKTLYEEDIRGNRVDYRKVINLQKLEPGKYDLFVSLPQQEFRQGLLLTSSGEVLVRPEDRLVYLLPTIRVNEAKVDLDWFAGNEASLKVLLQRANGEVVFEEELEDVYKVQRRYNLERLADGAYVMVVKTPYDTHYQRLILD